MNNDGKITSLDTKPWNNKRTMIYESKYMAFIHAQIFALKLLLKEFKDVFAWTYKDLKGIPPKLAQHKIKLFHLHIEHNINWI
jgi:hypothetical protein